MKNYNSIPHWNKGQFGLETICFNKEDGSNFRAEYSRKRRCFYKYGSRNTLINKHSDLGEAIDIFLDKYSEDIIQIFDEKYKVAESIVVFCEYHGENSFAGQHIELDEKDITLFDVNIYKKGIISPYEFLNNFGKLDIPKIIYEGKYDMDLINSIRKGDLKEGVVCKGVLKTKKDNNQIWMTKIKSDSWLKKVKDKFGNKYLLDELNGDIDLFKEI